MNYHCQKLKSGLYLVATPLGSARDITLRALDVLCSCDALAAEDTRSMRKLLNIHNIPLKDRPILSYNDFNGDRVRPTIMNWLNSNMAVAYASDAGMPLIADPGYQLSKQAAEAGFYVTAVPGASACITALSLSGLPTDRFFFEGFLPVSKEKRRQKLRELSSIPSTLIFYESPKRLIKMFEDLMAIMGENRRAVIARELTKKFEQIISGTLGELHALILKKPLKGELVVLLDRPLTTGLQDLDVKAELRIALSEMTLKDASDFVASAHGLSKRYVYNLALSMREN